MGFSFDPSEFLVRLSKYALEGIVVAVACYFFSEENRKSWAEILMIALTAACTFSLLDFFAPSMGATARQGAGFGMGAKLVGFPR